MRKRARGASEETQGSERARVYETDRERRVEFLCGLDRDELECQRNGESSFAVSASTCIHRNDEGGGKGQEVRDRGCAAG